MAAGIVLGGRKWAAAAAADALEYTGATGWHHDSVEVVLRGM